MNATKAEWTELEKAAQAAFFDDAKIALAKHNGRHNGYEFSIGQRKQIEECFGWIKGIGLMRKL